MINIFFTRQDISLTEFLSAAAKDGYIEKYGINALQRTKNGKPFIEGAPHFSYSNTAGASALCMGCENVGVDIERKDRIMPPRVRQRYFSDTAGSRLMRVWTAAEAFVKFCDLPLLNVLNSFKISNGQIYYKDKMQDLYLFYAEIDGFLIAAVSKNNNFKVICL